MPKVTVKREPGQFALDIGKKYMIPAEEIHCPSCGRFLGFQAIAWGAIEIKCTNSKCKKWLTLDVSPE